MTSEKEKTKVMMVFVDEFKMVVVVIKTRGIFLSVNTNHLPYKCSKKFNNILDFSNFIATMLINIMWHARE